MCANLGRNLSEKYSQKRHDYVKQSATDAPIVQKGYCKKQLKQLVTWLAIKLQIKLQRSQELHHRILQS